MPNGRSLVTALVLAHLLLLQSFSKVAPSSPIHFFMLRIAPAAAVLSLFLAVVTYALIFLLIREGRRFSMLLQPVCLGGIFCAFYALCTELLKGWDFAPIRLWPSSMLAGRNVLCAAVLVALLLGLIRLGMVRCNAILDRLLHALWPVVAILWIWTGMGFWGARELNIDNLGGERRVPQASGGVKVWILVFDELDYKVVFGNGTSLLVSPGFASMRKESFFAEAAFPPGGDTLPSVPSLLTGKWLASSEPRNGNSMVLVSPTGVREVWDGWNSLVTDALKGGRSVSVGGWVLPYHRLFRGENTYSYATSWSHHIYVDRTVSTLPGGYFYFLLDPFSVFLHENPLLTRLPLSDRSRLHQESLDAITGQLHKVIQAGACDLNWVHLPIPHWPPVNGERGTYLDNIKKVDDVISGFIRHLKERGLWGDSVVIVTADHWLRQPEDLGKSSWAEPVRGRWAKRDHRVPFMVHFGRNPDALTFAEPFNTVLLRRLLPEFYEQRVRSPQQLGDWIREHRTLEERTEASTTINMP